MIKVAVLPDMDFALGLRNLVARMRMFIQL